jgi:hypothetical protein
LKSAVLIALALMASPQLSAPDQTTIDSYRSSVAAAQAGTLAGGIEAAFAGVARLHDLFMRTQNGTTVLESLTEAEYTRLQRGLPGIVLGREEVLLVVPDVAFFSRLAGARGDAADRAFFAALTATYPTSVWHVYSERQTDYSGCTRFGSLSLVETYGAWSDFARRYPGRYAKAVKDETEAVVRELTGSTCACGETSGVERELDQFVRRFPASSVRPDVERRLQSVRTGQAAIRVRCISG